MNRMRPWRSLAARRAAKRRAGETRAPNAQPLYPEPLPPLVSPDDDREFLEPRHSQALELKPA